jgi:hypothetical protein
MALALLGVPGSGLSMSLRLLLCPPLALSTMRVSPA